MLAVALSRQGPADLRSVHDEVRFAVDRLGQWRPATRTGVCFKTSFLLAVSTFDSGRMIKGQIGQEPCYIEEGRQNDPGNKTHSVTMARYTMPEDKACNEKRKYAAINQGWSP